MDKADQKVNLLTDPHQQAMASALPPRKDVQFPSQLLDVPLNWHWINVEVQKIVKVDKYAVPRDVRQIAGTECPILQQPKDL